MNRLHKKCLVASLGAHSLLLVILMVGPAFLAGKQEPTPPVIDFIPSILLDEAISGGGNPKASPPVDRPKPEPEPPPEVIERKPPRKPAPEPEPEPEPPKVKNREPEPKKIDPASLEPAKPHVPKISLKVKRAEPAKSSRKSTAERDKRLAKLENSAKTISQSTAPATSVEIAGPGGGGPSYASYDSYVQRVYTEAWAPPDQTASNNAVVEARVVILSNGRVKSAVVTRGSGDSQVDGSVRLALDRVRELPPFPEGSKDKERTYTIKFDLKVKRGLA